MAQSNIIIVDDNPANLKLLEGMLRRQGHKVRSFPLGRLALAAMNIPPDLILLDINMPEMTGYEVCECLKGRAELADIPVIFLSALNETQDKVKGFQSGAVDYISKPFQFEEVHARVETHLKLHNLQEALKRQNELLDEAVAARTCELAEANQRLSIIDHSKSEFLNLISHELRTPLNGVLGISELILDGMPATTENGQLQEMFAVSRRRILSMVDDALLLSEIDVNAKQFRSAHVSLSQVISRAANGAAEFAESRGVSFALPSPVGDLVIGDEALLARALQGLLESAIRFSEEGRAVGLVCEVLFDSIRLVVESQGRTIPGALVRKFFDTFSIAEAATPGGDLGLGPALAARILSLFGASVSIANREPAGIQLVVLLKCVKAEP